MSQPKLALNSPENLLPSYDSESNHCAKQAKFTTLNSEPEDHGPMSVQLFF